MKGKATWERGWKGLWGRRLQKRLERWSLSWCSVNVFYCICSYTWYITNLYVDVGKLPNHLKLYVLYLFTLYQFLLYFIIQAVSNELRFIMLQYLIRFHYYLKKLFLQFWWLEETTSTSAKQLILFLFKGILPISFSFLKELPIIR